MKPIQVSRTAQRMPFYRLPEYDINDWTWYNVIQDNVTQTYNGETTDTYPYPLVDNGGSMIYATNISLWQTLGAFNTLSKYYTRFWIPYGITEGEWYYQIETNPSWLTKQFASMIAWWYVYESVKTNYYDVSVPDDAPGYTWKRATFTMEFQNDPILERTKLVRKLHDKQLYKTITTYYPSHLKSLQEEDITLEINGTVFGEYKYYDEEGELIRVPISRTFSSTEIITG